MNKHDSNMNIRVQDYKYSPDSPKNDKAFIKNLEREEIKKDVVKTDTIPSSLLRGAYGVIPFKGSTPVKQTNQKKVSFGANPLYDINLKKLVDKDTYKIVPAKFTQLIVDEEKDVDTLVELASDWANKGENDLTQLILRDFLKKKEGKSYFVTEHSDKTKDLWDRTTCLMQTTNPYSRNKEYLEINLLQSSPELINNSAAITKGSGELSLFGAVKLADENDFKKVRLKSCNDSFYEKMGFIRVGEDEMMSIYPNSGGIYELPQEKYDSFLSKISQKYNIAG